MTQRVASFHKDPLYDSSSASSDDDSGSVPTAKPSPHSSPVGERREAVPLEHLMSGDALDKTARPDALVHSSPPAIGSPPEATRGGALQHVQSKDEANALVKQLKRLEQENFQFSSSLQHVCGENAILVDRLAILHEKLLLQAKEPLSGTSVLTKLFDQDQHAGWLSGGKSATKERLQHTLEDLQNEFIAYKQRHLSSTDEVQSLIQELQSAHTHSANLSKMTHDLQRQLSKGPNAITVVIAPDDAELNRQRAAALEATAERLSSELAKVKASYADLQGEYSTLTSGAEELNAQFTSLSASYSTAQRDAEALTSKLAVTEARSASQTVAIDALQAAKKTLEKDVEDLKRNLQAASQSLQSERETWAHQKEKLDKELQQLRDHVSTLESSKSVAQGALTAELKKLRDENAALQDENMRLETSLEQLTNTIAVKEHMQREVLEETQKQRDSELQEIQGQLKKYEADAVAMTENTRSLEALVASLRAQMGEMQEQSLAEYTRLSLEAEQREEESASLRRKLDEMTESHVKDVSLLQERLVKAQEVIAGCEAQLDRSVSLQNFMDIETKYNALLDEVKLLQDKSHRALNAEAVVQSSSVELAAAVEEITALKSRIGDMERQKRDADAAHDKDIGALQDKLVKSAETIASMETQFNRTISKEDYCILENKFSSLVEAEALLREQSTQSLKAADQRIAQLEAQLKSMQGDSDSSDAGSGGGTLKQRQDILLKKCAAITQEKNAMEAKYLELAKDRDTLVIQLDKATRAAESSRADVTKVAKERDDAAKQSASVTESLRKQTLLLEELQQENECLKEDLLQVKQQQMVHSEKETEATAELEMRCSVQCEEIAALNAQLAELRAKADRSLREASSSGDSVAREKAALEKELAAHKSAKEQLAAELDIYRATVTELEEANSELERRAAALAADLQKEQHEREEFERHAAAEMSSMMEIAVQERNQMEQKHQEELTAAIAAAAATAAASAQQQTTSSFSSRLNVAASRKRSDSNASASGADSDVTKLKSDYDALQAKYQDALQAKVKNEASLNKKISQLEVQLETSLREVEEKYRHKISAYELELDHCQKHIASLREDVNNGGKMPATAKSRDAPQNISVVQGTTSAAVRSSNIPSDTDSVSSTQSNPEVKKLKRVMREEYIPAAKYYALKCENDKMVEEIKRQAGNAKQRDDEFKINEVRLEQKLKAVTSELQEVRGRLSRLQGATTNRSGGADNSKEVESGMIVALRTANESLTAEKEELLKKLGQAEQQLAASSPTSSSSPRNPPATLYGQNDGVRQLEVLKAKNDQLTVELVEAKRSLAERNQLNANAAATLQALLDRGEEECSKLRARVKELEGQVLDSKDSQTAAKKPKGKKRSTLLTASAVDEDDILRATTVSPTPSDEGVTTASTGGSTLGLQEGRIVKRLQSQLDESNAKLDKATKELAPLQAENLALKEKVKALTDELRSAQKDLEELTAQHEEELHEMRDDLRKAKEELITTQGATLTNRKVTPLATVGLVDAAKQAESLASAQQELESLRKENSAMSKKLTESSTRVESLEKLLRSATESYEALVASRQSGTSSAPAAAAEPLPPVLRTAADSVRSGASTPTTTSSALPQDVPSLQKRVRMLEEHLRQSDAAQGDLMKDTQVAALEMDKRVRMKSKELEEKNRELARLAKELLPTKQKLAEYMALADRLGIAYPFPEELEATQVVRIESVTRSTESLRAASTPLAQATPLARSVASRDDGARNSFADPSPQPQKPQRQTTTNRARDAPARAHDLR